jgi:hypothetical protein
MDEEQFSWMPVLFALTTMIIIAVVWLLIGLITGGYEGDNAFALLSFLFSLIISPIFSYMLTYNIRDIIKGEEPVKCPSCYSSINPDNIITKSVARLETSKFFIGQRVVFSTLSSHCPNCKHEL